MSDETTSVAELRAQVKSFVAERDWEQFHSPKNLSMALAIEAAELMEHFQWLSVAQSRSLRNDRARREAVGEEMADVLCYLLAMANEMDLDLTTTMQAKMAKNAVKYPVAEFRGRFGPDDPRPVGDGNV